MNYVYVAGGQQNQGVIATLISRGTVVCSQLAITIFSSSFPQIRSVLPVHLNAQI